MSGRPSVLRRMGEVPAPLERSDTCSMVVPVCADAGENPAQHTGTLPAQTEQHAVPSTVVHQELSPQDVLLAAVQVVEHDFKGAQSRL